MIIVIISAVEALTEFDVENVAQHAFQNEIRFFYEMLAD
jgi:hypothetical protein